LPKGHSLRSPAVACGRKDLPPIEKSDALFLAKSASLPLTLYLQRGRVR
jgi:hypothetical protein